MTTANQGMSIEEIKQIVAQRVANAIEAIAIYESINQTKQRENKVAGNVSNKRKWKGDHNESSSQQQNKEHEVFRAYTVRLSNKVDYAGNIPLCNRCNFHHIGKCAEKCDICKRRGHQARDKGRTFWQTGEVNPRYVGPFKVLAKVGAVAYKLELPQELNRVHNIFHVSNLKKRYADEPLAVPLDGLHINDKLHFMEEPVEIMDREVKRLKQIRILIIKVQWNSNRGLEFTWEREDQFRKNIHISSQKPHHRQVSSHKP
nr:putative reverse transcriptase domain-containing protein [Tanacetum cinerariifolium]